MKRVLIALLFLVTSMAGCSDAAEPTDSGAQEIDKEGGAPQQIRAPQWQIGDWWTHTTDDLDDSNDYTYVVIDSIGGNWIVATDSSEVAFFDARFDTSHMGEVAHANLAGSQQGKAVEMFRFPPVAGATWSTTWDGQSVDVTVLTVGEERATYEARLDGELYAQYDYVVSRGWYENAEFYDTTTGESTFATTVTQNGRNYTGQIAIWLLDVLWEDPSAQTGSSGNVVEVPADVTDLYFEYRITCTDPAAGAGGFSIGALLPPAGPSRFYGDMVTCPADEALTMAFDGIGELETWQWSWQGSTASTGVRASFYFVARTLFEDDFPFGP